MVTKEDLMDFAKEIDWYYEVPDYEEFGNKHKKLVELYERAYEYGLEPDYEYAWHEKDELIPCIVFNPYHSDTLKPDKPGEEPINIIDPGIPGIIVISRNGQLVLMARSTAYAFDIALFEDEDFLNNDDCDCSDAHVTQYVYEVFKSNSVKDMLLYLGCLSNLAWSESGLIVPISKDVVATYWTHLCSNGKVSYDRVSTFRIMKALDGNGGYEYDYERARLTDKEEDILAENLSVIKKIISEIAENIGKKQNQEEN